MQTLRESLEDDRDEPVFNGQKLDILLRELDINISRIAAFCIMIRPTCQR